MKRTIVLIATLFVPLIAFAKTGCDTPSGFCDGSRIKFQFDSESPFKSSDSVEMSVMPKGKAQKIFEDIADAYLAEDPGTSFGKLKKVTAKFKTWKVDVNSSKLIELTGKEINMACRESSFLEDGCSVVMRIYEKNNLVVHVSVAAKEYIEFCNSHDGAAAVGQLKLKQSPYFDFKMDNSYSVKITFTP